MPQKRGLLPLAGRLAPAFVPCTYRPSSSSLGPIERAIEKRPGEFLVALGACLRRKERAQWRAPSELRNAHLDRELPRRQALDYPPYSHLILLSFDSPDPVAVRAAAARFAQDWKKEAASAKQSPGHLLGPAPAAVPRRVGRHVIHILIKTHAVPAANAIILSLQDLRAKDLRQSDVALSIDVDPMDFW